MRLAGLAAFLHMRQHVEIELGIVEQLALADRRVVFECCSNKVRIDQELAQAIRDLLQRVRQRLRLEDVVGVAAKLIERVGHRILRP